VTEERSKEVTIILHEHETLTGAARQQINARKKRYVHFLEASFAEAMREGRIRPVEPRVAAFAFLGMVLWIYKWFRPDGKIAAGRLAAEMQDLFFGGLETAPAGAAVSAAAAAAAPAAASPAGRPRSRAAAAGARRRGTRPTRTRPTRARASRHPSRPGGQP
jgi:hypothetical protein